GLVLAGFVGVSLVGPFVLAKKNDLPLERVYGDFAVSAASRIGGGNGQNPTASDRRALAAGRDAYTGSCSVCHGASGDGRGEVGADSGQASAADGRGVSGFQLQPVAVPAPTMDQLDRADALSPDAPSRGAAIYFAQGCQLCHGPVGDAPANLGLPRGGRPEA